MPQDVVPAMGLWPNPPNRVLGGGPSCCGEEASHNGGGAWWGLWTSGGPLEDEGAKIG